MVEGAMREETDGQLVGRIRTGDLSAFEAIVDRHRAALVAVAAARMRSLDDAEDIAQDAFVQAYLRLRQLRQPEALLPWLRRLTDRLALTRLRKLREQPVEPDRVARLRASHVEPARGERMMALLEKLPERMRQTVALTYVAGYTCAEAAALLGVREGTVKSRLSRARAKLKGAFEMAEEDMSKAQPDVEFTKQTIERLMREARRLLRRGDIDGAADHANQVLEMQTEDSFTADGDPGFPFDADAARIAGLGLREKRRRDCEANAAQYGYRLEDLDWELCEIDVLCGTLGQPEGKGKDSWGIPRSQQRIIMYDARDVCRRFRCSPQKLHEWVEKGLPSLRCWPWVRFDWERVKEWVAEYVTEGWPKEADHDLDRPLRWIFRAIERGNLTAADAESIMDNLGWAMWGG